MRFERYVTVTRSLLLSCLLLSGIIETQSAITYLEKNEWGGRLGDILIMYTKAKWVAFHYNLPLLYKPFSYSDQLEMHVREQQFNKNMIRNYKKRVLCKDAPALLDGYILPQDNILYVVHYYFNLPHWGDCQKKYDSQEIMTWPEIYNDKAFISELKKNIAPRNTIELSTPPTDKMSVAVHVRTGGGFDHPLLSRQLYTDGDLDASENAPVGVFADKYWPLKFPPLQYYVDQIKRLSEMHHDVDIFLYVYTDSKDPVSVMDAIKLAVDKKNITFYCRRNDNHHAQNVLEDMFSIAHYDCLIRSGSNYPQISQLIGNHHIVIYPKSSTWIGNTMVIDEVGTFIRE